MSSEAVQLQLPIPTYIQFEIRLGFFKATHFDCFEATTCSLPIIKMNLIFNQENISKHVHTMGYLHVCLLCQMTFKWYTVTVIQTYFI